MARIFVGTSGWHYASWRRSVLSRRFALEGAAPTILEQRFRYWSKAFEGRRRRRSVIANVFSMFVRAPENDLNYGADVTLAVQKVEDRFSEAYSRAFDVPLLDHSSYYRGALMKEFSSLQLSAARFRLSVRRCVHPAGGRSENLARTP